MNSLVNCACGHTLEQHISDNGCALCPCAYDRTGALEALLDALRDEVVDGGPRGISRRTPSGRVLRRIVTSSDGGTGDVSARTSR